MPLACCAEADDIATQSVTFIEIDETSGDHERAFRNRHARCDAQGVQTHLCNLYRQLGCQRIRHIVAQLEFLRGLVIIFHASANFGKKTGVFLDVRRTNRKIMISICSGLGNPV